ncbi:hypothetical protein MCAP1_003502 [Malassezia caprae]|uniref:chitin deacetylase n=1 Tax=Malassezia caprae TaxID=1381934 RepID=A0AAF0EEJ2_9BASI|nr:hypothetical protein MCAP1_003502 [Malassezia caprae]
MQLSAKLLIAALTATYASASMRSESKRSHIRLARRSPTNAADAAKIYGESQECQYYGDPGVTQMLKKTLPKPNTPAKILDGDDQANQVWQDIQNSGIIPGNVKVKKADNSGGPNMGVQDDGYDASSDPDCWWTASKCVKPKAKDVPSDLSSCPEPDTWGLTFDDGPNCSHNAFYDFLAEKKLKATMFLIGSNVADWPYQAQRAITDGHDICVHTWSHRYTTTFSNEQVFAELFYTIRVIKAVIGVTPTCWRPPFGDVDDRVRAIAAGLGLRTILWQEDTDDWNVVNVGKQKVEQNYQNIIDKADSESPIVLTHEIVNQTMQMFMDEYPKIEKAYKNLVPITACHNITNPYPENIKYPGFSDFVDGKRASGLPDINSIKSDPNAKFDIVPLSKQKQGFANPGQGGSGSSDDDSSDSGDSSGSSGGNSAAGLTASPGKGAIAAVLAAAAVETLNMGDQSKPNSSAWGPQLDVDPLASNGITIEWKTQDDNHETEKTQEPTIEEGELWKMIRLLKEVLKEPSRESNKPDETLQQMLEAMDVTQHPNNAEKSETATKALAMELRLEKISMDDAEYAHQLDKIRGRLGALVTRLNEDEMKPKDLNMDSSASRRVKASGLFARSMLATAFGLLLGVVLLLILVLHWFRFRALYLFEFTYHDPLYQDFYPLPSYVEPFLSPLVSYNVPFTVSNHGLTGMP